MDTSVGLVKRGNVGHQPLVVAESDESFFSKNTKPFFFSFFFIYHLTLVATPIFASTEGQ